MITIFLGAPGTGKGTVAKILKEEYGFKHISTGDIFRSIISSGSDLGIKVKSIIEAGNLVNDETTAEVLEEGLKKFDLHNDRIILDGYPRTLTQAKHIDEFAKRENVEFNKAVLLTLDSQIQLDRLTGRLFCPNCSAGFHKIFMKPAVEGKCDDCSSDLIQREDDKIENVKERLNVYETQTKPLLNHYEDITISFDTDKDPKEIAKEIAGIFND